MNDNVASSGNCSTIMAIVNLTKLCVGAGILAIPYCFTRGGLILSPIGIGIIALWNGVSCAMMIRCKRVIDQHKDVVKYPEYISNTYSKISYEAFGWYGVYITDFSIVFTLLGVCTSFQIAFVSLCRNIPGNILTVHQLTWLSGLIVFPLSIGENARLLSIFSFIGLICLFFGIICLFGFGIFMTKPHQIESVSLSLFPTSFSDVTYFIGISVFCFGTCTLAFPVEESMKIKNEFIVAVFWSVLLVWLIYVIVGDGLAVIYAVNNEHITSNILESLPLQSHLSIAIKVAMAAVRILLIFLA